MTSKDIMIQADDDMGGGLLILREGDDEHFIRRTNKNSVKMSGVMAKALKIMRDDIIALQPLAKKGG